MPSLRPFNVSPVLACLFAIAGHAAILPTQFVFAAPEPAIELPASSAAITGREFGEILLPIAPINGTISFSAQTASAWDAGSAKPTRRLILENDVRIRLGDFDFTAKRAIVWLQKVSQHEGSASYQVYAILENVGGTTSASGPTVSSQSLPIRAVITTPSVTLKVDHLKREQPAQLDQFQASSEVRFADALRTLAGVPTSLDVQEQLVRAQEARMLAERQTRSTQQPARSASLPPLPRKHPVIQFEQATARNTKRALDTSEKPESAQTATAPTRPSAPQRRFDDTQTPVVQKPATSAPSTDQKTPPIAAPKPVATTPAPKVQGPAAVPPQPTIADQPSDVATSPAPSAPAQPTAAPSPTPSPVPAATVTLPPSPTNTGDAPIFVKTGVVSVSSKDITFQGGKDENSLIASGGVIVQYIDATADRTLEMTAQRAVVFMDPSPLAQAGRVGADKVRGIYLEGAVSISDGKNNLRGQKVFYDLQMNKGIVLDATYWTFDQKRSLPLYVRADAVRQESQDTFSAENARLSTTAFFDPDLSLGARSVTITRRDEPSIPLAIAEPTSPTIIESIDGTPLSDIPSGSQVDARGMTIRAYGLPIAYFPGFTGDPGNMPTRDVRLENSNASGFAAKVRWNLYGLLGRKRPDDFNADISTDVYSERGLGLGTNLAWTGKEAEGSVFAYGLVDDRGTDVLAPGTKIDRNGGVRGMILADNRWRIDDQWTLFTEASYIGDEAFVDAFYQQLQETRREFTTQMLAVKRTHNSYLTLQAKTSLNDFVANEYLLQSQGYSVDKLPEITYTRLIDDLLAEQSPGLLTWTHEYRVGVMGMNFDKPFAYERGFANNTLAQKAFGINGNQTIADRLRAEGTFQSNVMRADTRQEFSSQLVAGPVNINPFVVGRVTSYDSGFNKYAGGSDSDKTRFWGAAGTRISTTLQHVDDSVSSQFFDLNRMRHIIEPGVTLWTAGTNRDRTTLPVYDDAVESLAEGSQARIGLHQTWQTRRGNADKTRSVDVFRLDTDYIVSSRDADRESPLRRFYDPRPELSEVGEFFVTDAAWQATDSLAITGSNIYDFEQHQSARSSAGFLLEHGIDFATFAELRHINSQNSQFLDFGGHYRLSSKYTVGSLASYGLKDGTFQTVTFNLQRQSTSVIFGFDVSYNAITGVTGFGVLFRPIGTGGSGAGSRSFGGLPGSSR